MWAVQYYRVYLLGRRFTLKTDHRPLQYLKSMKHEKVSLRLSNWIPILSGYDFDVIYQPGRLNEVADGLSRRPASQQVVCAVLTKSKRNGPCERENSSIPSMKSKSTPNFNSPFLKEIAFLQKNDAVCKDIAEKLQNGDSKVLATYKIIFDCIFLKNSQNYGMKLLIPKIYQPELLKQFHNDALGGHFGYNKVYKKLSESFFWKNMRSHVRKWFQSCKVCQLRNSSSFSKIPMQPIRTSRPFELLCIDIYGPLKTTKAKK